MLALLICTATFLRCLGSRKKRSVGNDLASAVDAPPFVALLSLLLAPARSGRHLGVPFAGQEGSETSELRLEGDGRCFIKEAFPAMAGAPPPWDEPDVRWHPEGHRA